MKCSICDNFFIKRKIMRDKRMFDFFYSFVNKEVKHLDRYRVHYYNIEDKEKRWCSLEDFALKWRKELIPYAIEYQRSFYIPDWELFKKNKNAKCNSCSYSYCRNLRSGKVLITCEYKQLNRFIVGEFDHVSDCNFRHLNCPLVKIFCKNELVFQYSKNEMAMKNR